MMQGKDLVDNGAPMKPPPIGVKSLDPSDCYDMELARVSGYPNYSQDPQSAWDLGS